MYIFYLLVNFSFSSLLYIFFYIEVECSKIKPIESFARMGNSDEAADIVRKKAKKIATSLTSEAKTMADNETENERRNRIGIRYL